MENTNKKPSTKKKYYSTLPPYASKYKEYEIDFWYLFNNNAEVRRYVANAILNWLQQHNLLKKPNPTKKFVDFRIDKFTVITDGIRVDYEYTEPFFANCFCGGFVSFSADANKKFDKYLKEKIGITAEKAIDESEVNEIINMIHESSAIKTDDGNNSESKSE